jgi:hypothetical protein
VDLFLAFKFLHIGLMFMAVAAAVIPEVVLHLVASSRDARSILTFATVAQKIDRFAPILFVGGAVFGLLAAWSGTLDFTVPWLLATYVLFAIAMLTGIMITGPWSGRLHAAAAAAVASGGAPSGQAAEELTASIDDTRSKVASAWLMTTIFVILALMVFKPGG